MEHQQQARYFINSANKKQAQAAVQAVVDASMDHGINYAFTLRITPQHWEAGRAVGMARLAIKKLRGRKEHEDRGDDNERVDTDGATAELLLAFVFEHVEAQVTPLVAHKPDHGGLDLHLGGLGLDAKSVGIGKDRVCINHAQHSEKSADVYLLCHFADANTADVYVTQAAEVGSWRLAKNGKGKPLAQGRWYFFQELPKVLEPLEAK